MKKYIIAIAVLFIGTSVFAQDNTKVKHEQKGDLIETTYFYADGSIQQKGTFNKEGQLHGTWTSYDAKGNKVAIGNYKNGKKDGKWTFVTHDGTLNEVHYADSKITKVAQPKETKAL